MTTTTATTRTIATDDDVDDTGQDNDADGNGDSAGDDASSTTSDKGDNRNRDNGEDACYRRQQRLCISDGNDTGSTSALTAGGRVIK